MVTLARKRLSRAKHFLALAQQHSADRERFTTYFETFVVYGRSVLHVLKMEVDGAGVSKCFEDERNALGAEALPQFFRGTRDTVLKLGSNGTRQRAEYSDVVTVGLYLGDTAIIEVTRADGSVETQVIPPPPMPEAQSKPADAAEGSTRFFFTEGQFKNQDLSGVGRQYLHRLAQAIDVAERCGA